MFPSGDNMGSGVANQVGPPRFVSGILGGDGGGEGSQPDGMAGLRLGFAWDVELKVSLSSYPPPFFSPTSQSYSVTLN